METCLSCHCQVFGLSQVLYKLTLYQLRALICGVATHSGLPQSDLVYTHCPSVISINHLISLSKAFQQR